MNIALRFCYVTRVFFSFHTWSLILLFFYMLVIFTSSFSIVCGDNVLNIVFIYYWNFYSLSWIVCLWGRLFALVEYISALIFLLTSSSFPAKLYFSLIWLLFFFIFSLWLEYFATLNLTLLMFIYHLELL